MKLQQITLFTLILLCFGCNNKAKKVTIVESEIDSGKMKIEYVGRAAENKGMHVWGSSPIKGKDGKTHLFAAQWPTVTQPNFNGWYKDCEIGHYVSDSPEGPFEYVGVVVEDQDGLFNSPHNPTISNIDGQYQLCFIVNENDNLKTQLLLLQ